MTGYPDWRLRPLRPADSEAAAALIRAAFATQSVRTDPLPSALRESAEGVAAMQGGVVAEAADGTLAGVALWTERDGGLYVGRVSVTPSWRGRGIARAMLAAAEAEARSRHLPVLRLGTRLVLADNRRLFAACGFAEVGESAHPGYAHPTMVHLEKRLAR